MDIVVNGISKSFEGISVLQNFTYRFPEHKTICIMGHSGCGKTTLANILLGLVKPDIGEVSGVPYEKLGAVFQEDRLCENLSAKANLRMVCSKEITEKELKQALLDVGLKEAFGKPVRNLSGGMRRRVAVLRALLKDADCIIMDEPLNGLDEETKKKTIFYIKQHSIEKTMIVITHNKTDIDAFDAADVIVMGTAKKVEGA